MPRAIGDPEELERFASALQGFIEDIKASAGSLDASFSALGDSWQDEKRVRFEEEYQGLQRQLASFETVASDHVPYLLKLASRLRDYLQS